MIYNESELLTMLQNMLAHPENELLELKEACNNKAFNEIGQYFSALSNEANLHGKQEAWLIFGVSDN
ncbi:transcriptional regulator, partial [bacterium]|nr:transcriptional regulator [bacterium]